MKLLKSLEDSSVLNDGITETIKYKIRKKNRWISWVFASIFSHFINTTSDFFSSKTHKWKRS